MTQSEGIYWKLFVLNFLSVINQNFWTHFHACHVLWGPFLSGLLNLQIIKGFKMSLLLFAACIPFLYIHFLFFIHFRLMFCNHMYGNTSFSFILSAFLSFSFLNLKQKFLFNVRNLFLPYAQKKTADKFLCFDISFWHVSHAFNLLF